MSNPRTRNYQSIRFGAEPGQRAYVCTNPNVRDFRSNLRAEIIDESATGCGLAMYNTPALQPGDRCITQVGRLQPLHATVIWRHEEGDATAVRVGLRFDE